jgi:hypothetical protein
MSGSDRPSEKTINIHHCISSRAGSLRLRHSDSRLAIPHCPPLRDCGVGLGKIAFAGLLTEALTGRSQAADPPHRSVRIFR